MQELSSPQPCLSEKLESDPELTLKLFLSFPGMVDNGD